MRVGGLVKKNKIIFKNAIKIKTKGIEKEINRIDILDEIHDLDNNAIEYVDYISQMFNNHTWIVTFKSEYSNEKLIGKSFEMANKRVVIVDANQDESIVDVKLRILWLPHNFKKEKIGQFLNERYGLQVADIIEEELRHEKYQNLKIKNGNFLVKCKLDLKTNKNRLETGINEIDGNRVLISRIGGPIRCLTCNEYGHIRRNCPRKNDRCSRCNKLGHVLEECTMAKRIGEHTEELPDDSEQAIEEEHEDSIVNGKPAENDQTDDDMRSEEENTIYQQNEQGLIPIEQIEEKMNNQIKENERRYKAIESQQKNTTVNPTASKTNNYHHAQKENKSKRRESFNNDATTSNSKTNSQTSNKKIKN